MHAVRSDGFAGVERHVARLARAQAHHGDDVTVVGGAADDMRRELDGVRHLEARTVPEVARRLAGHGRGADVVHVHMTAAEIAAGLVPWARHRPAVVATRHFAAPRGSGRTGPFVARLARHAVQAQIAVSRYVADHVDGPTTVVYPGVDVAPSTAEQERVVLVLQRLEPEKATDVALRAVASSGMLHHGWRLQVAGTGSQAAELAALADRLGLRAELLGHRADVDELLGSAGILLAPCPVEGLGLSVLEAMAHALPVVAADAGGHTELLAGLDDRALFPPGDAATAGDRLRALAADDAGRAAYGRAAAARQRARYTLAAQVAGTADVYEELL
ncbi:glycosyltransferase family 4 protein [Isoptericola halotolerans]